MHILKDSPKARAALLAEIRKLEALVADLKSLAAGHMPSPEVLAASPLLDQYDLYPRQDVCLIGTCVDHPQLHGPTIFTSQLWVIVPELGFARTYSRYYRLGRRDAGRLHDDI